MDPVWGLLAAVAFLGMVGLVVCLIVFGVIMGAWLLVAVGVAALAVFGAMAWGTTR